MSSALLKQEKRLQAVKTRQLVTEVVPNRKTNYGTFDMQTHNTIYKQLAIYNVIKKTSYSINIHIIIHNTQLRLKKQNIIPKRHKQWRIIDSKIDTTLKRLTRCKHVTI